MFSMTHLTKTRSLCLPPGHRCVGRFHRQLSTLLLDDPDPVNRLMKYNIRNYRYYRCNFALPLLGIDHTRIIIRHISNERLTLLLGRTMTSPCAMFSINFSASANDILWKDGCTMTRFTYCIRSLVCFASVSFRTSLSSDSWS